MGETQRLIKDLKIALKDLEPMVRGGDKHGRLWLKNGNNLIKKTDKIPIEGGGEFNLRYRETWANRLLCVTLRYAHNLDLTFGEYQDTDGIIIDRKSGSFVITEHVAAMNFTEQDENQKGEGKVISAINHKISKGKEYVNGKFLVVFSDGMGKRYPNKVAKTVKDKHHFKGIYCIGLITGDNNKYVYSISQLLGDNAPTYTIEINSDFTDRKIKKIQ